MVTRAAEEIDPLAPCPPGRYSDHRVTVFHDGSSGRTDTAPAVRTAHFRVHRVDGRIEVRHRLRPAQLDNDLAGHLLDELFNPGWLPAHLFESVFTGVVRSTVSEPLLAWETFYGNTLARLRQRWGRPEPAAADPHSPIAQFAEIYRTALHLVPDGSVLDLGSCFGFFPLLLAGRARGRVLAADRAIGSMRLLARIGEARAVDLWTLVCDAASVPLASRAVDTVTVIHLLEHLEPGHGDRVLEEARRLARTRVIVAVPFEREATAAYGHVRTFTPASLRDLASGGGGVVSVFERCGGWLVVDAAP